MSKPADIHLLPTFRIIHVLMAVVWFLLFSGTPLIAEPFVPRDDQDVLEVLPSPAAASSARALRRRQSELTKDPENLAMSLQLAKEYIETSRAESDPRYLGYAEATLAPWWHLPQPPIEVLVLRATVRQSSHDFESALADLAQVLKLTNNILSFVAMAATAEAFVMGGKGGVDLEVMLTAVNAGSGRNSATLDKFPRSVATREFTYGAEIDILVKDADLAIAQGEALGVPMWVCQAARLVFKHAQYKGAGRDDFTTIVRHIEEVAGHQIPKTR